jgi:hypothetical protein
VLSGFTDISEHEVFLSLMGLHGDSVIKAELATRCPSNPTLSEFGRLAICDDPVQTHQRRRLVSVLVACDTH